MTWTICIIILAITQLVICICILALVRANRMLSTHITILYGYVADMETTIIPNIASIIREESEEPDDTTPAA